MLLFSQIAVAVLVIFTGGVAAATYPTIDINECKLITPVKDLFEKLIPSLISDKSECSLCEQRKIFTNCFMALFTRNTKLCDVEKYNSCGYRGCKAAFTKLNKTAGVVGIGLEAWWNTINNNIEVGVEMIPNRTIYFLFDAICPKLNCYLLRRFEAYGGKIKNDTIMTSFCQNKDNMCDIIDKYDSEEFFRQAFAYIQHPNLTNFKEITEAMAGQLYFLDSERESKDLADCLYGVLKDAVKKLHK